MKATSFVIFDKQTGKAVMETFNRATADAVNRNKFDVLPTLEYLQKLNRDLSMERKSNPTKKFSPAQIAAQKLFAERARAGTLGQRKKRKPNPGLYENIDAKRKRIAAGSGEKMRKPGQAGRPTAEAFEQSARTAKGNPIREAGEFVMTVNGKSKTRFFVTDDNQWAGSYGFDYRLLSDVTKYGSPVKFTKTRAIVAIDEGADGKPITDTWNIRGLKFYKTNPDKDKPNVYIKRVSQATGAPPTKRLVKRRTKALFAPAGYFPNPKAAAMMTGYQVIGMLPKKNVVGIFKTMARAKNIATFMADANGVPYGVKTVKVHKAHFAV